MSATLPSIAIVGTGAIGSLLRLRAHTASIALEHLARRAGLMELECTELNGKQHRLAFVNQAITAPVRADIIVLPLKAYQIESAVREMAPRLSSEQTLVLLHNGMGTLEQIQPLIPNNPIVAATTSYGALKTSAHQLQVTGQGQTQAGWVQGANPAKGEKIRTLLDTLLPPCQWYDNVLEPLWHKLAVNAVINPLTALHNVRNGELLKPNYAAEIEQICSELASVMTANELEIDAATLQRQALKVASATAANSSSMRQDVLHHRLTEIQFINGYVCRQGLALNIPTPVNQYLTEAIEQLSAV